MRQTHSSRRSVLKAGAAIAALSVVPSAVAGEEDFPIIASGVATPILADPGDFPGVLRAVRTVTADFAAMTGNPQLGEGPSRSEVAIIVGTLGRNATLDRLVRQRKLDTSDIAGRWEGFVQQVVDRPMRGVRRALVIAGADKRGTIFGLYDLAERIGVSPWTWWADVPIPQQRDVSISSARRADWPRVKYRGIFLNDEEPALGNWVRDTFGAFNAQFYERVFELILRLKGNYLWPAMWGKAIYDDDPASPELADEMGVVLATSHHEPMTRAHVEWERYGGGTPWDYTRNEQRLRQFWREGIERMGDNENVVTIGMRGDGDEAMTEGTAIPLLERIVRDQRQIIEEVTGRPASETPQVWALYKEVQDYYDQGMQVPDDVTLLFADDNWGNIRRLPDLNAPPRAGGYGVYYHFDYVGGPRNYKWLNTNQIERTWEQMQLAREYGADRIWVVNVGDLKPMEFPISFFLDMAWNPEAMPLARMVDYPREWAAKQFGPEHAAEIGDLLTRYAQLAARRKPELLAPDTFSLTHFNEAERVRAEWDALRRDAQRVEALVPQAAQAAYFQLVNHPILANANQHELYIAAGRNRLWAEQGRAAANAAADEVERLFAADQEITAMYHALNGGKWNHMMSQTHIGYRIWQQPETNIMPEVRRLDVATRAAMGVAVEGDARAYMRGMATLPALTPYSAPSRWIDVFNQDETAFDFTASSAQPWLRLSQTTGRITDQTRIEISVDWSAAPVGVHRVPITLRGAGRTLTVTALIEKPAETPARGFVEANNVVAMEAAHYSRAIAAEGIAWTEIPHLSRALSGVSAFPRTHAAFTPGSNSPRLEYDVHLFNAGEVTIDVVMSPTMNFTGRGVRYAVSIDDSPPQIVNAHEGLTRSGEGDPIWNRWVATNSAVRRTTHQVAAPGAHVVKLWLLDPGLVFQRLVLATGDIPQSYLGPPESVRVGAR